MLRWQKASQLGQIFKKRLIVPKFVNSQATSLFGKLKREELKQLVLCFLQKKYNLTLLLFVFLIVSLLLMMFELLPLVSSCLLSPLLFIALFNEFLLFTELDFDKLVAVKKMKISPLLNFCYSLGTNLTVGVGWLYKKLSNISGFVVRWISVIHWVQFWQGGWVAVGCCQKRSWDSGWLLWLPRYNKRGGRWGEEGQAINWKMEQLIP